MPARVSGVRILSPPPRELSIGANPSVSPISKKIESISTDPPRAESGEISIRFMGWETSRHARGGKKTTYDKKDSFNFTTKQGSR